jgi:uncharacterized membrane protein YphA (DoxX/SURF4 family)
MSSTHTSTTANNALNLAGRVLLAALFLPAGIGKLTGFAGPCPQSARCWHWWSKSWAALH